MFYWGMQLSSRSIYLCKQNEVYFPELLEKYVANLHYKQLSLRLAGDTGLCWEGHQFNKFCLYSAKSVISTPFKL